MNLSDLLQEIPQSKLFGKSSITIKSISDNSRNVKRGSLFIAIKGLTVDGYDYIPKAIEKGAVAVVGEKPPKKLWEKKISYVQVPDSRKALGSISSIWFGKPSEKMIVIGVTGTKGKTTTVHMITHILNKAGKKTGFISSVSYPGLHVTNPGCVELNRYLKTFFLKGCRYAVVEVSSHGIDQQRIAGITFDIGVLTNISPEHLDYHKTFENYKNTKLSFINSCKNKVVLRKKTDINIFPGGFNNLNAETAVQTVIFLGINREKALLLLQSFKLPKGRLEEVKNKKGIKVYIDFAHTPDSLKEVLTYLKSVTKGRLIAVFGCAGERDTIKRSVMGKISTGISDFTIFTAEDPRSEDVNSIINQIASGVDRAVAREEDVGCTDDSNHQYTKNVYYRVPERGEAISYAIQKIARKGDTVVICGKGHEKSMAYNGVEYPWSDQEAVRNALRGGVKLLSRPGL